MGDSEKKKGGRCLKYTSIVVVLLAISLVVLPNVWVYVFMALDFYTNWHLHDSTLWGYYHQVLTATKPDREALPLPEMDVSEFSREKLIEMSNNFTFPVVVRGVLKGAPALELWQRRDWWLENYGDEEVLCKPGGRSYDTKAFCTIREWYEKADAGQHFYINGASSIFRRRPELAAMVDTPLLRNCSPIVGADPLAIQIFMGQGGSGSPLHAGLGVNLFRQVVGRKRWWFVPLTQSAFVIPSITANGFSMHAAIKMGALSGGITDPMWNKLLRYTAVLQPGDLLLNPPWIWHAIENLDPFTIGAPSRYADEGMGAAFRSDPVISAMAVSRIISKYGSVNNFKEEMARQSALVDGRDALERGIAENRDKQIYDKKDRHFD